MTSDLSIPDAELSQQPARPLTPLPAPPRDFLSLIISRPKLAAALAKAQQKVRKVAHDGAVDYPGRGGRVSYAYTTSEAIIEAAKDPLSEAELALLPLEETLNGHEKEGLNRFELECKFLLLHSSGESLPLVRHWPVCPDQGRPLDKATAAASTLALSYLLRDLLLMPRVASGDDVSGREDEPAPSINAKAVEDLLALLTRKNISVKSVLKKYRFRHLRELTPAQLEELTAKLNTCPDGGSKKGAAPSPEQPASQQPAQQPAPASGDHDPAELIDAGRRLGLAKLLQAANLQFGDLKPALGLGHDVGLSELTYGQAEALAEEIARRAAMNRKPKGASNG